MFNNSKYGLQRAIGASSTIIGSLALFGIIGYWLDKKIGDEYFWLIIGLVLGVVIGLYELGKYIIE